MTLRVAILIHDYYPLIGGAQALLRAQAPHLQAQGAEVTILTRRVPGTTAFEYVDGIPVHRLPVPPPRPLASMTFTLAALAFMLRRPPDVIHANEFISPATTALLARRFIHKPVVLTPHSCGPRGDIQNLQKRTSGQARLKAIREQADAFVVINDEISAELHSIGVLEEKLHFIKNGVDVSRFAPLPDRAAKSALRQRLELPTDATVVIFTGRLVVGKRVNYLLEIWPAIRAVQPKAELLILGDGDQRATLTKIAGEGVHFLGAQDDVTPYLQAADIFVLPSVQEGLSVALLEAMSCGLAPLTTTVGGNIEVICDGENGLLIPPDDLPALRSMLEKLVQDPGRCAAIGAAARNRVETSYSVVSSARQLFQLYLDLTKAS